MNARDIGEPIHYVSHGTPKRFDGSQAYTQQCRAAWITVAYGGERAGIMVANPDGLFFNNSVAHDEGKGQADWSCDGLDHSPGTWHYRA